MNEEVVDVTGDASVIFTTYFKNLENLDLSKYVVCSIARYNPTWVEVDYHLIRLAPPSDILWKMKQGELDTGQYTSLYYRHIQGGSYPVDLEDTVKSLKELSEQSGKEVLLCCYEKPEEFCHRHLLANLIKRVTGENIRELTEVLSETKDEINIQSC